MAGPVRYPTLFQINTRVWLQHLCRETGKRITLADIDDATLDGSLRSKVSTGFGC
jgi:hypothetical protein